jgi:hypothetical protein
MTVSSAWVIPTPNSLSTVRSLLVSVLMLITSTASKCGWRRAIVPPVPWLVSFKLLNNAPKDGQEWEYASFADKDAYSK